MKLPNWFKIAWWVFLLIGLGILLTRRYNDFLAGKAIGSDILVLIVWLALLLLPLFQEISLFGLTFKKEFEALKSNVKEEIASIKADIRNSVDVRTQISPSFVFPPPPPDSQLPAMEKRILAALERSSDRGEIRQRIIAEEALAAPPDVEILFRARYNIERQLRRIWNAKLQEPPPVYRPPFPTLRIAQSLAERGLIPEELEAGIRELWSVASPAIHGEAVSPAKVAFVREVAPMVIAVLKAID